MIFSLVQSTVVFYVSSYDGTDCRPSSVQAISGDLELLLASHFEDDWVIDLSARIFFCKFLIN